MTIFLSLYTNMLISLDSIIKTTEQLLTTCEVPSDHIAIINDSILYAHVRGKGTHGIGRVPIYVRKIQKGLMAADTPIHILHDFKAILHLDAGHGFGQVAADYAMKEAIHRARDYGISCVEIRNSNNFGTAGYFSGIAADQGMIGVVMGNSAPAIAPGIGGKAVFGTNPVSIAMPSEQEGNPFLFDMATSAAARGKIRLAEKNGESIPEGWALDPDGNPTTDPSQALKGTMVPIGGYKGVGISMVVDLIAGMLSGSAYAGDVKPLNNDEGFSRYGHTVIVIDPYQFINEDEWKQHMRHFREVVHKNHGLLPGESSYEKSLKNAEQVTVSDKQIAEINALAEQLGISARL